MLLKKFNETQMRFGSCTDSMMRCWREKKRVYEGEKKIGFN